MGTSRGVGWLSGMPGQRLEARQTSDSHSAVPLLRPPVLQQTTLMMHASPAILAW